MGKFSKIFHHIETKDLRNKHEQKKVAKIEEEKKKEDTKKYIASAMEQVKYNWRSKIDVGEAIREGMTTSDVATISTPANPDEVLNDTPLDNADDFAPGARGDVADFYDGTVGTSIKSGGSGSGNNGGFDIGNHLAFDGDGSTDGARWMITKPVDTTNMDHIVMSIITGNDSNGGETPDDSSEGLYLYYKTPQMNDFIPINYFPTFTGADYRGGDIGYPDEDKLFNTVDGPTFVDMTIIPVGGGTPTLQDYTKYIPSYARGENTQFLLYQFNSSGTGKDNYGVKNISYRRKTPIQVVAPLDTPEASSFIRGADQSSTPKKRKKAVDDKLEASDEYTTAKFGNEFPGQEVRVGGEDPFKSAKIGDDVKPSPQTKEGVKKSFADFQKGDEKVEVIRTPEQIQAENDQYFEDLNNLLAENEYDYTDPQVLEITDKILKNDPKNIDAYYYKSAYYDVAGDIEGARKVVDEMVKNNPDSPDGYALRSFYRQEEGDLAGAIEDLEKTVELDPDSEYVAYIEMELADLKFQEAEVETDNAERERIESEAAAVQEKAHQDYWNNADLIEQEQEELAEYQYVSDEQLLRDFIGFGNFYGNPRNPGRSDEVPSMLRAAQNYASQLEHTDDYDGDEYQEIINAAQSWEGTPTEWAKFYTDAYMRIVYPDDNDPRVYNWIYDGALRNATGRGAINAFGTPAGILGNYKLSKVDEMSPQKVVSEFKRLLEWWYHSSIGQASVNIIARSKSAKLNNLAPYLNALAKNLPDYYFETDSEEPINTLYDQMKALYDEEDPEKEIKTELKTQGYEKQYKDLMTAWDSADKFSKFITPLKNLSDALLGSKTAQNAKYENYKIAIAKSIMLNKPIRVNPDTIDPVMIKKLGDSITPNQILSYEYEQKFKDMQKTYARLVKEGKGDPNLLYDYDQPSADGIPLIPIVSEPVPYADENIYEDEFGRVVTNDGSVANTTFQPDRNYHGFANAYVYDMMRKNPIAGRGQAQYQIVVPPDGSEPYLLYKDHAYHNMKSTDEGEVPGFMNKGAAGFVNWLGNTAHARSDGDANTGGMAGYPPNIRGDVITEFRIPITDLSKEVAEAIYRHPLMTEQPELVQVLRDQFYTDEFIKTSGQFPTGSNLPGANDPTGEKAKNLHNFYNNVILKRADQLKDFVNDNALELFLRGIGKLETELPEGLANLSGTLGEFRTASNMLQRYDDFIQQTIYSPNYDPNDFKGEKGYVPGFTNADGSVVDDGNRVDVTDLFTKRSQGYIKSLLSNEKVEEKIKEYVAGGKTVSGKKKLEEFFNDPNTGLVSRGENWNLVLANTLGNGTRIDIDQFLNGRLVLKKNYEFRHDENIDQNVVDYRYNWWSEKPTAKELAFSLQRGAKPVPSSKFNIARNMAKLWDVSNDTWPAGLSGPKAVLTSVITMTAARQLLHPVQGPGQSFASAMNTAPPMPYKLEFDVAEKIMNILNAEPEDDISKDRFVDGEFIPGGWPTPSDLGSAGEIGGVDATSAATAAATTKKKKKPKGKVNESNLYERLKKRPFFNQDDIKPEFPENPPPKLDPKTGMHPQYGKKAKRYGKLDPISANSMPPTGDPEIDAVVNKQKTINKIKKMARNK